MIAMNSEAGQPTQARPGTTRGDPYMCQLCSPRCLGLPGGACAGSSARRPPRRPSLRSARCSAASSRSSSCSSRCASPPPRAGGSCTGGVGAGAMPTGAACGVCGQADRIRARPHAFWRRLLADLLDSLTAEAVSVAMSNSPITGVVTTSRSESCLASWAYF